MEKIYERFEALKRTPSDINEHMDTLREYGEKCDHITEMGVRTAVSTWALLAAKPKFLVSYDINACPAVEEIKQLSVEHNISFTFFQQNVLTAVIAPTDLLFIDTLHTYAQLMSELITHAAKVNKYIIMHDTSTFGQRDELPNSHPRENGLKTAINDFLSFTAGKDWHVEKNFTHNNGLTILSRKSTELLMECKL